MFMPTAGEHKFPRIVWGQIVDVKALSGTFFGFKTEYFGNLNKSASHKPKDVFIDRSMDS